MTKEKHDTQDDTDYLLRSPKNKKRLIESISRLESELATEKKPKKSLIKLNISNEKITKI